jgi:hypothetical protein
MEALDSLFSLPHLIKVYVPSTMDVNQVADNAAMVESVETVLSGWFGGATAIKGIGAWMSDALGLVLEDVTIVQSFAADDSFASNIPNVVRLCERIKSEMSQEAVALEVDSKLYLV